MTEIPEWVAIYSDKSVFSSLDGTWEEAPAWGMCAVIYQSVETGWSPCLSGDYFIKLDDGSFLGIDETGLIDHAANVWKKIKVGRYISRDEYNEVVAIAFDMMQDIRKTAKFRNEER